MAKYDLDEDLKEKPFSLKLFKRTIMYIRPYKKQFVLISVLLIAGIAMGIFEPIFVKWIIDNGILPKNYGFITEMGFLLLAVYLIGFVAEFFKTRIINKTSQGVIYDIRKELFEHLQTLSFRFFDGRPAGKIISRLTNDVTAISNLINNGLMTVISQAISIIGILAMMLILNLKLALISLVVIPLLLFLLMKVQPATEKAWTTTRKTMSNINANLNETLQGIRVIQAFSRQSHNIDKFEVINRKNYKACIKATALDSVMWPSVELTGAIGSCIIIWFGASDAINGLVSLGTIVAFINYLWRFWGPLSAISKVYSQILSAMASSERIFQILDTPPEIVDLPDAVVLNEIKGHIRFENVSFGYNPEERMVLSNINFDVQPGQMVALVGPTGAGKSSIINLLMRFYDPDEGRILVDGHDLRKLKIASLRDRVGMVLQESFLFSGSIKDNILYGNLEASEDEIFRAADAARVTHFTQKFSQGFDTEIEERGAKLSVGQRQLLSFSRALISDPSILILDEATSSVDTETERMLQETLRTALSGRTAIVIAHRLSTIEKADKIIVIGDGQIVEEGTHSELIEHGGIYCDLYNRQFVDEE